MATLELVSTGERHELAARHLVGRAADCLLRLEDLSVSGEHGVFRWTGEDWEYQDLGSRNGTQVNGQRLGAGEKVALDPDDVLIFGAERNAVRVLDVSAPVVFVQAEDGERVVASEGLLVLPDAETPEVTVFEDSEGRWLREDVSGTQVVEDGAWFEVAGRRWQLRLPVVLEGTWEVDEAVLRLGDIGLRFGVSRDEEHVEVTVLAPSGDIALTPRAHAYFLLTLARARLEDAGNAQLNETEHGWLSGDELGYRLDLSPNHLSVSAYRCRKQLAGAGVQGAAGLIERRASGRQLRIGVARLEVVDL
ncbi:MAG: FHA domain-containing protein [Acidobacteriota bacterium]